MVRQSRTDVDGGQVQHHEDRPNEGVPRSLSPRHHHRHQCNEGVDEDRHHDDRETFHLLASHLLADDVQGTSLLEPLHLLWAEGVERFEIDL